MSPEGNGDNPGEKVMAKQLPKWESDEEYMEWARGEARAIIRPIEFHRETPGGGVSYDAYHGVQNEDD